MPTSARTSLGFFGQFADVGIRAPEQNGLLQQALANESASLPGGEAGRRVALSRRDFLRIARRFNAGKHPAWLTSPEGTAEG